MVLPRLKTDLIDILCAIREEKLDTLTLEWADEACACVVMASGGYPAAFKKGLPISGLNPEGQRNDAVVYHAGTKYENGKFYTNGGRVLGITALGATLDEALDKAYDAVEKIRFQDAHYRKDIGRPAAKTE